MHYHSDQLFLLLSFFFFLSNSIVYSCVCVPVNFLVCIPSIHWIGHGDRKYSKKRKSCTFISKSFYSLSQLFTPFFSLPPASPNKNEYHYTLTFYVHLFISNKQTKRIYLSLPFQYSFPLYLFSSCWLIISFTSSQQPPPANNCSLHFIFWSSSRNKKTCTRSKRRKRKVKTTCMEFFSCVFHPLVLLEREKG